MIQINELLLALLLVSCLMLAVSSRLLHCIRLVSFQGILLGILPLTMANTYGEVHIVMPMINLAVKGIILPFMLCYAMKKANIKRELEPSVGYSLSAAVILILALFSFFLADRLGIPSAASGVRETALAASFALVMSGLFIVIARKKALTQVIGFLVFENGITLFGSAVMREHPWIVELGILLDVLVLVFIMVIAINQISRAFEHVDSDRLNQLDDLSYEKENC